MIKLNVRTSKGDYVPIFMKIKEMQALKVVDGETVIFLNDKGFILGKAVTVKETPEEVAAAFLQMLTDNGKEIGVNGIY